MDVTGDELAELYRRYGHLVLRRCRSILRDEVEALDVMQDVFVRAMRYEKSIDRASSRLGWLYRTAERACFDRLRARGRQVEVEPAALDLVAREGFERPDASAETREVVLAFLGRFDAKVQRVAVLHYVDGLPQEEIAAELGWSRRTVGKKLALLRARSQVLARSLLARREGRDR